MPEIKPLLNKTRLPRDVKLADLKKLFYTLKKEINEIDQMYEKYFNTPNDKQQSLLNEIEEKITHIKDEYNSVFDVDEGETESKFSKFKSKIDEITTFHQELITNENSIQSEIEECKTLIYGFHNYLFTIDDESDGQSIEEKTKKAITEITDFHTSLTEDSGIQQKVENIHSELTEKYSDLFEESEEEKSKVEKVQDSIEQINAFEKTLDEKQKFLNNITSDLEIKRREVNSLLSEATAGTLAEGYLESKIDYSKSSKVKFHPIDEIKSSWSKKELITIFFVVKYLFLNTYSLFDFLLLRHFKDLVNYLIFIIPLLIATAVFIFPDSVLQHYGIQIQINNFSQTQFLLYKLLISLPLLWIAWFGQRNISLRRRLSEEYNHKQRVTQMYLLFLTNKNTYTLEQRKELEDVLLETIRNNPAAHLGRGETLIDSLLDRYLKKGLQGKIVENILEKLNLESLELPFRKGT